MPASWWRVGRADARRAAHQARAGPGGGCRRDRRRAAGSGRPDAAASSTWQLPIARKLVLLYRACWRLGAIAAPLHHQAGAADVERMLGVLDPAVTPSNGTRHCRSAHTGRSEGAARPSDLAIPLFTGGSTGEPKAVLHTHRGLAHKALTMVRVHGLRTCDAVLMPRPPRHSPKPERHTRSRRGRDAHSADGALGSGARIAPDRDRRDQLHDRSADVLRAAHGRTGVHPARGFRHSAWCRAAARASRRRSSCQASDATRACESAATDRPKPRPLRPALPATRSAGPPRRMVDPSTSASFEVEPTAEAVAASPELFAGYADPEPGRP